MRYDDYDEPQLRGVPGDVYGRQSKGSDRSIGQQLGIGQEWAAAEGAVVNAILSDPVSASPHARAERDDWPKLISDVETGRAKWVWLWESSRGDRTAWRWLQLLETCRDRKVLIRVHADRRLYDVASNPRDWHTLADDAVENQWESEKTRSRVLRDLHETAEGGWFHGPVAYGFERRYEMRRGRMAPVEQHEHPGQVAVVRRIFDELDAGVPVMQVARGLDADGVPTRRGGPWSVQVIRSIALNYAYIGMRSHDPGWKDARHLATRRSPQAKLYPAVWPALVGEEQFYRVRRRLLAASAKVRPGKASHLLSLVAACECGEGLAIRTYEGPGDGNRPPVYRCLTGHTSVYESGLDRYVIGRVLGYLARPAVIARLRAMSPAGARDQMAAAEAELAKAEAELAEMERELLPAFAASFARAAPPVQARITDARERITALNTVPELGFLLDSTADLADAWDSAPMAARRAAVRRLASVTVARGGVRVPADRRRVTVRWLL